MLEILPYEPGTLGSLIADDDRNTALLLDGVNCPDLLRKLYECDPAPDYDLLYLETELKAITDISPCLVPVSAASEIFRQFSAQGVDQEWGYLIRFNSTRNQVLAHLRNLLTVQHISGVNLYLKVADPAVIAAMLQDESRRAELMGPIAEIITVDTFMMQSHRFINPKPTAVANTQSVILTEKEQELLSEADFRRACQRLMLHLDSYFPAAFVQQRLGKVPYWQLVVSIAEHAYELGFQSERDMTMFANVLGFLKTDNIDPKQHPDIHTILYHASEFTPAQRVEHAARLAQQYADNMSESLI